MRYLLGDEIVPYIIFLVVILVLVLGTHRTSDGNVNNAFSKVASETQ
jgi:hypothetical protein